MHEMSLVHSILDSVFAVSREHGGLPVRSVRLDVGEGCHVVPELLEFAFKAAIDGTVASGAALELGWTPLEVLCTACETHFKPRGVAWRCPECGAYGGRAVLGDALVLLQVELESAD